MHRLGVELQYWRDGRDEVGFVFEWNHDLYVIEVKSGRRRRQNRIVAFKKRFPKAKSCLLDWESESEFLQRLPDIGALRL